jgi:biopolymer transport protein ExbB
MDGLSLSPLGLFLAAGLVGKFVMGVLILASVWCWVLIVEGVISVVRLGRAVRAARAGQAIPRSLEAIAVAGDEEARRRIPGETVSDLRGRIADAMARAARELLTRSEGGLPNLAVISSVAPFVGLFGTVWGILNALVGIGIAGQASIDKVAGPVGEALIMTALGLFVAVPAVMGYNWLLGRNKLLQEALRNFASDLQAYLVGGVRVGSPEVLGGGARPAGAKAAPRA